MQAAFCFEHLLQAIPAMRRQPTDTRQHRIQFGRSSSFTSGFSPSSSSSTVSRGPREDSSVFGITKALVRLLAGVRGVRGVGATW
jgi:hypothetical protein